MFHCAFLRTGYQPAAFSFFLRLRNSQISQSLSGIAQCAGLEPTMPLQTDRIATGSNAIMGTLQIGKTHSIQKVLSKRNQKLRVSFQNWFRCTSYSQPFCCTFLFLTYIVPKNTYDRPYIFHKFGNEEERNWTSIVYHVGTDLQSAATPPIVAASPELHIPSGILGDMQAPASLVRDWQTDFFVLSDASTGGFMVKNVWSLPVTGAICVAGWFSRSPPDLVTVLYPAFR